MNRVMDMELLRQPDAAAELRIAEEFPIDWGEDALFEQIYQRYLGETPEAAVPRRSRAQICRIAGLAACLLLTVGLGCGVWSRQQKLPVQPPVPVTEPATDAPTEPQESEPPVTEATLPAVIPAATETQPMPEPTEPPGTDAPVIVETDAPEDSSAAEPPPETQAPPVTEAPTAPPVTEAPTAPPATEPPAEEQLEGFKVLHYAGFRQIICTDAFPEPDGVLQDYTVDGDAAELLETAESADAQRSYQVACRGRTFTVTQREYAAFVMDVEEGELINISVNRAHGFFHLREEQCTLYWFRDGEGFCISGDAADLTYLLEIARSFTPADASN